MSLLENLSGLERNMKEEGIYFDSLTLNNLQYYFMEKEELNKIDKAELFNEINDDILFMAETDKVMNFFEEIFTDINLISHFNVNFALYIDLTKQGEVEINDEADVENLSSDLIRLALIQLIGEEELEEVISFYSSIDFSILKVLQDRLKYELESKLKDHFKPLAERSAELYEEFELAMTQ